MPRPCTQKIRLTGGPGRRSLFPGKDRERVLSVTFRDEEYAKLTAAAARLSLTLSDLVNLLVYTYAPVVEVPPRLKQVPAADLPVVLRP